MRYKRLGRLVAVAVLAIALIFVPETGSNAAQTRPDLATAQAQLLALNLRLQVADESYNQAVLELARTRGRIRNQQLQAGKAQKIFDQAQKLVSAASANSYMDAASPTTVLMSADSIESFAERLNFLEDIQSKNSDLALRASVAARRATRMRRQLKSTLASENATLNHLASIRAELQQGVAQTESLLQQLRGATFLRTRTVVSRSHLRAPPAPNAGAQKALNAAYSVIGVPYRYAGASPSEGFDCSGLTMWSWNHAGVSLPHSAAEQYNSIVHVSRSQLQPGDLVFFYSPISHVGMYVGGGRMIEAPHTGETVRVIDVYWGSFVGAGRPGV